MRSHFVASVRPPMRGSVRTEARRVRAGVFKRAAWRARLGARLVASSRGGVRAGVGAPRRRIGGGETAGGMVRYNHPVYQNGKWMLWHGAWRGSAARNVVSRAAPAKPRPLPGGRKGRDPASCARRRGQGHAEARLRQPLPLWRQPSPSVGFRRGSAAAQAAAARDAARRPRSRSPSSPIPATSPRAGWRANSSRCSTSKGLRAARSSARLRRPASPR